MRRRGFTLIELLVTFAIVGFLATIFIPIIKMGAEDLPEPEPEPEPEPDYVKPISIEKPEDVNVELTPEQLEERRKQLTPELLEAILIEEREQTRLLRQLGELTDERMADERAFYGKKYDW